jgi:hypothetical protein
MYYIHAKHTSQQTNKQTNRQTSKQSTFLSLPRCLMHPPFLSPLSVCAAADACCIGAMANAALYAHYPLPDRLVQNPAPTPQVIFRINK